VRIGNGFDVQQNLNGLEVFESVVSAKIALFFRHFLVAWVAGTKENTELPVG